jgi:hypothetical protein
LPAGPRIRSAVDGRTLTHRVLFQTIQGNWPTRYSRRRRQGAESASASTIVETAPLVGADGKHRVRVSRVGRYGQMRSTPWGTCGRRSNASTSRSEAEPDIAVPLAADTGLVESRHHRRTTFGWTSIVSMS